MKNDIPVVDLFAGPGGLGEGFSSLKVAANGKNRWPFRIALSVEKEASAYKTLRLRSYFRLLLRNGESPDQYYKYVSGEAADPFNAATQDYWEQAGSEALQLEIGGRNSRKQLHDRVEQVAATNDKWVLIGGPPCQAYSLAGRARNKGKKDYKPELDKRHFLYTHYLELITQFRPAVFVMENVKGILSSKVSGTRIFTTILDDLRAADDKSGKSYRIYSLSNSGAIYSGPHGGGVDPHDFIVRSELHGIPQARHRVILVGIREDIAPPRLSSLTVTAAITVSRAIADLPKLRSVLSAKDTFEKWQKTVKEQAARAVNALAEIEDPTERRQIKSALQHVLTDDLPHRSRGALRLPLSLGQANKFTTKLRDKKLSMVLNHEARGHMAEDLARYLFAAAYGRVMNASPSQAKFPEALAPDHESWFSGYFADRFRVQIKGGPATTITCHIAKDGHYYIHHDPRQCRSLTVREAARIQTFPDNYFFEGNRTEQYVQVGNAVPPLLARQIADRVWSLLNK